jgi:hypothetical protein
MLAVVARFKWVHIDYLAALGEHFDVRVAWSGEGGRGAPEDGVRDGMRGVPIGWIPDDGVEAVRARLAAEIEAFRPDVVHVMYYNHEDLTLIVRELVGNSAVVVFECRDPITTLTGAVPGSGNWQQEREALAASDGQLLISRALRDYYERSHGVDLEESSLIVPYGFARNTVGPPSPKLSAVDGRTHIALVGTADDQPDHGRWYGDIIRELTSLGLVVHSHFWNLEEFGLSLEPYLRLERELPDYHFHPTVPYRRDARLSEAMSRYDLMGVFHELEAAEHNESATLAVCLPTKAVCGWLHGAMPVVCYPHYRGVVERIEEHRIGFVVERLADVAEVAADRQAIAAASERALACRDRFTNEHSAARIREFVGQLLERGAARVA